MAGARSTVGGLCHGSAYEIRVRSPERIQFGSDKQSHLRSAKRIHSVGVEPQKTVVQIDQADPLGIGLGAVVDGSERGRGKVRTKEAWSDR